MNNEVFASLIEGLDLEKMYELKGFDGRYLIDVKNGRVFDTNLDEYKKNTVNSKGYIYHRLVNPVTKEEEVISLHRIVMRAVLEVDYDVWRSFNFIVDHRNDVPYDCRFENLQLITQSENLKKRKKYNRRPKFTNDELDELYNEFSELNVRHGELMETYAELAERFNSAVITIQYHYLNFKKLNQA